MASHQRELAGEDGVRLGTLARWCEINLQGEG